MAGAIRSIEEQEAPRWAIIIPSYRRLERLFTCLLCLRKSINAFGQPVQITLMDNAPVPGINEKIKNFVRGWEMVTLAYRFMPQRNQSELRNAAIRTLDPQVANVFILDSDIYIGSETLVVCDRFLSQEKSVAAVAPPLGTYFGGKHHDARVVCAIDVQHGGPNVIMPSRSDYAASRRHGSLLETLMLRCICCSAFSFT